MYLSNEIGKGMEMSGRSSGLIQSVGYEGQTRAAAGSAPGGFIMYSGSFILGSDSLSGVGLQLVGPNDDRHMIFTTAGGGLLDIKADKFFIGNTGSQFISGSDGNIEISSSNFHLQPNGDVTLNGTITAIAGDIGGFTITSQSIESKFEISSSINALVLNASGSISGSTLLIRQNYGGTLYELINTQTGIADFKNLGREIVSDNNEYICTDTTLTTVSEYPVKFLEGETHLGISFHARGTANGVSLSSHNVNISIANTTYTGSSTTTNYYDVWDTPILIDTFSPQQTGTLFSIVTSSLSVTPGNLSTAIQLIPTASLGNYCKLIFQLNAGTAGADTRIKNINIFATRQFSADSSTGNVAEAPQPPSEPS
jgi:hypothetical protein